MYFIAGQWPLLMAAANFMCILLSCCSNMLYVYCNEHIFFRRCIKIFNIQAFGDDKDWHDGNSNWSGRFITVVNDFSSRKSDGLCRFAPKASYKKRKKFPRKETKSDQTPILKMIYDMFEFYQFKSDFYFILLLHLLLYYFFIFYKTSCLHFNTV